MKCTLKSERSISRNEKMISIGNHHLVILYTIQHPVFMNDRKVYMIGLIMMHRDQKLSKQDALLQISIIIHSIIIDIKKTKMVHTIRIKTVEHIICVEFLNIIDEA